MWLLLSLWLALAPVPARAAAGESFLRACEQAFTCLREAACSIWPKGRAGVRVHAPVPGLYASIPNRDVRLPNVEMLTKETTQDYLGNGARNYPIQYKTIVAIYDRHRAASGDLRTVGRGDFTRSFSESRDAISFDGASLYWSRRPEAFVNVPGVTPLVAGKGIPLQALVTLLQMKRAGVPYGGLKVAESSIDNERTLRELAQRPAIREYMQAPNLAAVPGELIAAELPYTHTYRYLSTVLTQSGHRITRITVRPHLTTIGLADFELRFDLAPFAPGENKP